MIRVKRSMVVGAVLAGLVLALLASVLYVPTQRALERAESFNFRRMAVTRIAERGAYRFFFATNRQFEPGDEALVERAGTARGEALRLGSFDTVIEPALGLGMILNPTEWLRDEEIKLDAVRVLEREAFVEGLRDLVSASPRRSLLVVLHGFRESFPSALRKTAFLAHVLDIDSPVLLFDWPGDQGASLRGYRRARGVATASGAELAEVLGLVVREVQPERLWVIANSMGAQVVVHGFSRLARDPEFADPAVEFEDVVLTAPDVDHAAFNRQFKAEIASLTRDLTVYVSSNDRALVVSRLVNRRKRLGESTLGRLDEDQFAEAARVAQLIDEGGGGITLVDVTPVNRTRNFHNFSLETPEFFDDLFLRLTDVRTPLSRRIHPVAASSGAVYWVLTRGE